MRIIFFAGKGGVESLRGGCYRRARGGNGQTNPRHVPGCGPQPGGHLRSRSRAARPQPGSSLQDHRQPLDPGDGHPGRNRPQLEPDPRGLPFGAAEHFGPGRGARRGTRHPAGYEGDQPSALHQPVRAPAPVRRHPARLRAHRGITALHLSASPPRWNGT